MRSRTESLKRYTEFINEVLTLASYETKLPRAELQTKYGVNSKVFSYMVTNNLIKRTGRGLYKTNRTDFFTEKDTEIFMQAYNRYISVKKKGNKIPDRVLKSEPLEISNDESSETSLSDIPTEDIIAELRKRGYSGILEQKKKIRI